MRRSRISNSVWTVLLEELRKVPALLRFHTNESVSSATKVCQTLKGENPDESPELREKRQQHRAAYEEILRQQQEQVRIKSEEALKDLSLAERIKMRASALGEALKEATSTNAGAMALLQHCAASHAAEVAVEEGIDVKNVSMRLEKKTVKNGTQVGHENVVVGYIDAPNASEEQVMAFAEKLQKRCPVANAMEGKIEWRSTTSPTGGGIVDNNGSVDGRSGTIGRGVDGEDKESIPRGTPGYGRYTSSTKRDYGQLDDPDELHLPGTPNRSNGTKDK
ncbi:OsmC/Ohr family [Trypanosoma melophagium]|uniref:OsmC/Ohr family n=1 Tax=Trypanosoma melophagium TaxID=715481 RepID=UPI00351A09CD|nr:OsmC/Ohr family [Trypanosoma melophagium]